ncbi:MAG: hypothetical protein GC154_10180 [bacterium]|nr:hypothetical protein [bacterium]
MSEVLLNGVVEEEVDKYLHVCFFTDRDGLDLTNEDHYVFIPKQVCRVIDYRTLGVQDWYVRKKKLGAFVRGNQAPSGPGAIQNQSFSRADWESKRR